MYASLSRISTIVRTYRFASMRSRLEFLLGGRLLPEAVVRKAATAVHARRSTRRARARWPHRRWAPREAGARHRRHRHPHLRSGAIRGRSPTCCSRTAGPAMARASGPGSRRCAPPAMRSSPSTRPRTAAAAATHTTLPDFTCHLLAVAQHFGPAAAVIGHSLGGAATALALARGLEAQRAVLIAPAADPLAAVERFSPLRLARRDTSAGACSRASRTRMRFDAGELQAHHNAPAIGRPALIVHDVEDREVPWSEGERYARFWRDSRLLSTRGLGHNRIADDAGVIAAALRFLRGEDGRRARGVQPEPARSRGVVARRVAGERPGSACSAAQAAYDCSGADRRRYAADPRPPARCSPRLRPHRRDRHD